MKICDEFVWECKGRGHVFGAVHRVEAPLREVELAEVHHPIDVLALVLPATVHAEVVAG
jgi:hypothetical protein